LADRLKVTPGVDAELIEGSGGVFDVVADGVNIFSKHDTGRFPDEQEIIDKLGGN
jgi:selenoprotein W-related protein